LHLQIRDGLQPHGFLQEHVHRVEPLLPETVTQVIFPLETWRSMQKKETRQMFQPIAATDVAGLPAPLPADSKRQAVHSISGTVYQAWCSIEAWTRLEHANQVIYLEGAEDFDIHDSGNALTVQVRQTSSPISLGTEKTRVALEHFWSLTLRSSPTIVEYHYLTTSTIARERDVDFDGLTGIEVWMSSFESVDSSI
jgi:hypothetical protein